MRTVLETTFGESVFTTVGPADGEPDVILHDGLRPDLEARPSSGNRLRSSLSASLPSSDIPTVRTPDDAAFPGKEVGLSRRESEVLGLIVQGRTNQEIGG